MTAHLFDSQHPLLPTGELRDHLHDRTDEDAQHESMTYYAIATNFSSNPRKLQKQRGFTLIEISIVLFIIGTILVAVLQSQGVISSAKAKDIVAMVSDLRAATSYFQQRYNYLPGDFPITTANEIPNVAAPGGNGNGIIEGAVTAAGLAAVGFEVSQAPWQLYNAGFISTIDASDAQRYLKTSFGPVQLVSQATANGLVPGFTAANPAAKNAILFFNLPCDVANEADTKLDDGNLATGKGMGSVPTCTGSNLLPVYAVAL